MTSYFYPYLLNIWNMCLLIAAAAATAAGSPYANVVWGAAPADMSYPVVTPQEVTMAQEAAAVSKQQPLDAAVTTLDPAVHVVQRWQEVLHALHSHHRAACGREGSGR